jgi:hypothetical protein
MEDTPGGPQWNELHDYLQWNNVAAHNSEFEARISNRFMHDMESVMWIDTAVISRHLGGSSALEKAAVQFLPVNKVEAGKALIKKFCMGGLKTYDQYTQDPDWTDFEYYCSTDAALSWRLAQYHSLSSDEISFNSITTAMNRTGWYVDVAEVEQMQELADKNKSEALALFQYEHDPKGELNLNSLKQMKEWCLARGVSATSFSEDAVVKLLAKFAKREETHGLTEGQKDVRFMLQTKLTLGGSSLSKLEVIKRLVSKDGRLRDQYMHAGAGQSMRTSGRGVQMQNLKRLTNKLNMDDRYVHWRRRATMRWHPTSVSCSRQSILRGSSSSATSLPLSHAVWPTLLTRSGSSKSSGRGATSTRCWLPRSTAWHTRTLIPRCDGSARLES